MLDCAFVSSAVKADAKVSFRFPGWRCRCLEDVEDYFVPTVLQNDACTGAKDLAQP